MAYQRGVTKQVRYKSQTAWETIATNTGGQVLRRVSSALNLQRPGFGSAELRPDQQRSMYRLGTHNVVGTLSGELSPGTYRDFQLAALRAAAVSNMGATTAQTTISTAVGTPNVFTRSGGSYLTDGHKVGDVVRPTGLTGNLTGLNNTLLRIVALTATAMTAVPILNGGVYATWDTMAAGPSITIAGMGRKALVPATAHADPAFTIEEWFPDVPSSERFVGCKINTMGLNFPASGIPTISFGITGREMQTGASAYFGSPTAITTTDVLTEALGWCRFIGGTFTADEVALTSMSLNLNNDISTEEVALSLYKPGDFPGILVVNGQITVLFGDTKYRDAFLNETQLGLSCGLVTSATTNTDFMGFTLPRIVFADRSKNDPPKSLMETIPFEAVVNTAGGAGTNSENTTLVIQDGTWT